MCGLVPFGEECEDPFEVYQLISANAGVVYPKYFDVNANKYARQMIEQLLSRTPEARLGGSYAALKAHRWFERFDWVDAPHQDLLLDMNLQPPYQPAAAKLLGPEEINKIAGQNTSIIQAIEKYSLQSKKTKKIVSSKSPNWDQNF